MQDYVKALSQQMVSGLSQTSVSEPVNIVHLANAKGMVVSFVDIGATWFSCVLPVNGQGRDVLLGPADFETFLKGGVYFGPIVGRYANRISNSRFSLHGQAYLLQANEGRHSIHGGPLGYDRRRWLIAQRSVSSVVFTLRSPNGDQGYPGNLDIAVRYHLTEHNALEITYDAKADADTFLNLTNHAYFNLAGEASGETVLGHKLRIDAAHYVQTKPDLIPVGHLQAVKGTGFDFQTGKLIGRDLLQDVDQRLAGGYDHAFVFAQDRSNYEAPVIELSAPDRSVKMFVSTTKPAVQFYSGQFLGETQGKHGQYSAHSGMALETQFLPDGPNHPEWDGLNGYLRANEAYRHKTTYKFIF